MDRETRLAVHLFMVVAVLLVVAVMSHLAKLDPRRRRIDERLAGLASAQFHGHVLGAIGAPTASAHDYVIRRVQPGTVRRRLRLRGTDVATGNAEFDARFSLECDDPGVAEWLGRSQAARALVEQLVDADRHLKQRNRRLQLVGKDLLTHEEQLDSWAVALHRLAALVPNREAASEPRMLLMQLAASTTSAAAVFGLVWAMAAADRVVFPQNASLMPLLLYGGLAGASLGGAWLWLVRHLRRGSRRPTRQQQQFIVAGAVAPAVFGMVAAAQFNLHWGDSLEHVHETEVVSVDSFSTGGRSHGSGRNFETLTLGAFAEGRVPEQSYRSRDYINKKLWPGQRVRVHWRVGALGVPVITRRPTLVRGIGGD